MEPDSPSPSPRLRRSPTRRALHERTKSHTNSITAPPSPTIRLVTKDDDVDDNAKYYTTSPFPTTESQLFLPPGTTRPSSASKTVLQQHQQQHPRGRTHVPAERPQVSKSHTPSATSRIPHHPSTPPINATRTKPSNPLTKHYGSIANAFDADGTKPPSTPATQENTSEELQQLSQVTSSSSNIDVDRLLEMDRDSIEYRRQQYRQQQQQREQSGSPSEGSNTRQHGASYSTATTSSSRAMGQPRTPDTGASLQAISSRASSLPTPSDQDTPASQFSTGSAGTVVRNRASQVATPAGYYRLFPPASRHPGSVRSTRSNSDPVRPLSMEGQVSPPSPGSPGSPVSPLSPTDTESPPRHGIYSRHAHARSDTALELSPEDVRIPIVPQTTQVPPSRVRQQQEQTSVVRAEEVVDDYEEGEGEIEGEHSGEPDRFFTIRRRPLPRRDPTRWTLALSTVVSESTEDRSSSGNGYSIVQPSIASSGGAVEVSNFPMPETARERQRRLSNRRSSSGSPIRIVSPTDKELPPLPENGVAARIREEQAIREVQEQEPYQQVQQQQRDSRRYSKRDSRRESMRQNRQSYGAGQLQRPQSAHLRSDNRASGSLRQERPETSMQRNSMLSFTTREFRETIPAWARSYYAHEARNRKTIGARPLSSASLSPSQSSRSSPRRHTLGSPRSRARLSELRVPGNRARAVDRDLFYRDSMAITPLYDQPSYYDRTGNQPLHDQPNFVEIRGSRLGNAGEHDWSPHLFYDRRSAMMRRTVFLEPSIDLSHEGRGMSKRNLQVWCFAVGFVMPLAWLIAAFLPLPPKFHTPPTTPGFEQDLEKAYGARDQARYENARWWRNINRVMAAVGIAIVIAVIVLVVVSAKT